MVYINTFIGHPIKNGFWPAITIKVKDVKASVDKQMNREKSSKQILEFFEHYCYKNLLKFLLTIY